MRRAWTQETRVPKLAEVAPERPRVTDNIEPQNLKSAEKKCVVCCGGQQEMYRCSACHSGVYCSKACQKNEWKGHKDLCAVIQQLESHLKDVAVRSELLKEESERGKGLCFLQSQGHQT